MRKNRVSTMSILMCMLAVPASAGVFHINNSDDSFLLYSHSLGTIFGDPSPYFSTSDLASAHLALSAWGIDTDGKVTILPVDTSAGLTFLTLVDREFSGGDTGWDASLGITSTAPNNLNMFINDYNQDSWTLIQPPFGSQTMGATFVWGGMGSGDGFAWAGLSVGDALSYNFVDLDGDGGALDAEAFQFVGWVDNAWKVISSNGFKSDGSSVFTSMVVPAPPTMLLFTAAILGSRQRRRSSP